MSDALVSLFGASAVAVCRQAHAKAVQRFGEAENFTDGYAWFPCRSAGFDDTALYLDHLIKTTATVRATITVESPAGESFPLLGEINGEMLLFVDLCRVVEDHLAEAYRVPTRPVSAYLPFNYRVVPGRWRQWIHHRLVRRRRARHVDLERTVYPRWPVQDIVESVLGSLGCEVQRGRARFVFSHDVDGAEQLAFARRLAAWEADRGIRATFFIPAKVLCEHGDDVAAFVAAGHEIGVHGWRHDNRQLLYEPAYYMARLTQCRDELERFGVKGYRAPCLLTNRRLRQELASLFAYDSSIPDTDVYAEAGLHHGCGFLRPYPLDGMTQLPVTLPLDDRLATLGRADYAAVWLEKARWVLARGGTAVLLTHAFQDYYPQGFETVFDALYSGLQRIGPVEIVTAFEAARGMA
ncbi:MAG: polysaccharide deacetylase family protein [Candidatus Lernaella stagnicola]|nr:polysaccharide deacetylase family protein [Candidatus Lernaella stagnicola]